MKIGIFQDLHANLPALKKALAVFKENHCDKIVHVGDLIGIGPHPKEVFDLATQTKNLLHIMGNHDYWYAHGIPIPLPRFMNEEEFEHHQWVHQQIGSTGKKIAQTWKFIETFPLVGNKQVTYMHYGYDAESNWFKNHIKYPTALELDEMFNEINSELIFYGHNHLASDIQGKARYVNLGSAGCHSIAEVRLGILEIKQKKWTLEKLSLPYQDNGLMEDFELRKVPAREFITSAFITRK